MTERERRLALQNAELKQLISHIWVHSGYPDCGYLEMTSEQKILYNGIIGRRKHDVMTIYGWVPSYGSAKP